MSQVEVNVFSLPFTLFTLLDLEKHMKYAVQSLNNSVFCIDALKKS